MLTRLWQGVLCIVLCSDVNSDFFKMWCRVSLFSLCLRPSGLTGMLLSQELFKPTELYFKFKLCVQSFQRYHAVCMRLNSWKMWIIWYKTCLHFSIWCNGNLVFNMVIFCCLNESWSNIEAAYGVIEEQQTVFKHCFQPRDPVGGLWHPISHAHFSPCEISTRQTSAWVHSFSILTHSGMIPETGEEDVRVALPADSQRQRGSDGDGMRTWRSYVWSLIHTEWSSVWRMSYIGCVWLFCSRTLYLDQAQRIVQYNITFI